MCCLLCSCYYLCNLVVFVKVNGWNSQNIFSLTLHVFWIGFCNCIGIYVVSFSFNYTTDGWTRAVDPVTILGSTAVTARGNAFFWLNDIWGLQIRKTSYPINLSLKASPSV
jgi:hypothetical protein